MDETSDFESPPQLNMNCMNKIEENDIAKKKKKISHAHRKFNMRELESLVKMAETFISLVVENV